MATRPWNVETTIKAELQPGEMVRWMGKPTFLPMLTSKFMQIVFGAIFAAVGVQQAIPSARSLWLGQTTKDLVPALISAVFIIFGLWSVATACWEALATWRTAYAVTNRRVLIVRRLFRKRVLAFAPAGINAVETRENFDGSGTVVFRREIVRGGEGDAEVKLAFVGISDVGNAAREIEKLRLNI